jgi:hypothetical protein
MTDVPKLAFFEVPTRTPAAQFSLPGESSFWYLLHVPIVLMRLSSSECGNKCINNQNFRGCSALDSACVCKAAGIDPVSAYRCILDTCNPTDAAVSMLEFAAQCGMTVSNSRKTCDDEEDSDHGRRDAIGECSGLPAAAVQGLDRSNRTVR